MHDIPKAAAGPKSARGAVLINNEVSDPTGEYVFSYLLHLSGETPFHDFKRTIDISKGSPHVLKIVKDVYAFSNYGGGWLVLGVAENDRSDPAVKSRFVQVGLPEDFRLEDASLQEKINSYMDEPIAIQYREHLLATGGEERRFAMIYFPPSSRMMIPPRDVTHDAGGQKKAYVKKGTVYTRRGTQSVPANPYETELIRKRLEKEEYRLSILSGEPDEVHEVLYTNLFEVKSIPEEIYTGTPLYDSFGDAIEALRLMFPGRPYIPLSYSTYRDKIVTLANLADFSDIHSKLVDFPTVKKECTRLWLDDPDRANIVVGLLNRELAAKASRQGMRVDRRTKKLYYAAAGGGERKEVWSPRYKKAQRKRVVKKMWAQPLGLDAYLHHAVRATIMRIGKGLYLRLNPTMAVTTDGKTPETSIRARAFITSQSYGIYNKLQLNSILFWIDKLGGGEDVSIGHGFTISREPVQAHASIGIAWDIPVADWKQFAEEFAEEAEHVSNTGDGSSDAPEGEAYDF